MKTYRRKDLSPAEIQYRLTLVETPDDGFWTFAKVDRHHDLKPGTARKAARSALFDGEIAIAAALQLAPHQIWPSRYDKDGSRLKPQPPENYENYNAIPDIRKCLKNKAA